MGSSDSGGMFLWSFVTIALHTTKACFGEGKIVLSRNLHTRVNGFSPFPHVHGVFCAGKFIATSAIDHFIVGPKNGVGVKHLDYYYGRFI